MATAAEGEAWVRETRFGRWFLGTAVWRRYVLAEALDTLVGLLGERLVKGRRILDLGCGQGMAFPLLVRVFEPSQYIGVDIDSDLIAKAHRLTAGVHCRPQWRCGSALALALPDASVDVVFCHQILHHVHRQAQVLAECRRVLARGGVALVAESCRSFIESTPVRLLFCHPRGVQHTAAQYLALVRSCGLAVDDADVAVQTPWWSRGDLGLGQRLGWTATAPGEPTEVLMLAWKP
jgi:SAM-dependent methyltransferase